MQSVIDSLATAIVASLTAEPDRGAVIDHQPMPSPNDWEAFIATFTAEIGGTTLVRAWTIQYLGEERRETNIARGAAKQMRDIAFIIRAHFGWNQAGESEKVFRGFLERVADRLDTNRTLGGAALDHDPVDVEVPLNGLPIFLGDVMCHYAEIRLVAQVEITLNALT